MPQPSEFDRMFAIAQNEIHRDAPKIAKNLDLSAGAQNKSEPDMLSMLQRNWSNPQTRQWFNSAYAPDKQVELYLKAAGVTNPDGTPMSVAQYQRSIEANPTLLQTPPAPADEALAPAGTHQPDPMASAIAQHPTGTPLAAPPTAAAPDSAPESQPMPITPGGAAQ